MKLTADQQKVANYLKGRTIPSGLGDTGHACTIAAINLALTGVLTDGNNPCVCPVIRNWVIPTQDAIPDAMRNADAWRSLVPLIAGSRADEAVEKQRAAICIAWMWERLASIQHIADAGGYGSKWSAMCTEQTVAAARAAWAASGAWAARAAAYWATANPAGLLAKLLEVGALDATAQGCAK